MQLTSDHETYDEGYGGPVLSSYLGIPTDTFVLQIQEEAITLHSGDRLLLCSDGLYKQISENDLIQHIKAHFNEPAVLLQKLVDEAVKAEHSDNVTIVYVEIE